MPRAPSLVVVVQLVKAGFIGKLSKALFMAEQDIDPVLAVNSAGVDSLAVVGLKYWFLETLHAEMANIVGDESSRGLCDFAVERSGLWKGDGWDSEATERAADEVRRLSTCKESNNALPRQLVKTLYRPQVQLLGWTSYSAVSRLLHPS